MQLLLSSSSPSRTSARPAPPTRPSRGHGGLNLERGVGQSVEELPSTVHLESRSESEKKVVGRWSVPTFEPKSWEGPPEIWIQIWGQSKKWSGKDWASLQPALALAPKFRSNSHLNPRPLRTQENSPLNKEKRALLPLSCRARLICCEPSAQVSRRS